MRGAYSIHHWGSRKEATIKRFWMEAQSPLSLVAGYSTKTGVANQRKGAIPLQFLDNRSSIGTVRVRTDVTLDLRPNGSTHEDDAKGASDSFGKHR
jgi:hypothetical protein